MKAVILNATILALALFLLPQHGVAQAKSAAKQTTLTGCLQNSDEKDEYTLNSEDGKEYRLFGTKTANLAPHVGHKVTITGTPTKPRMEAKEAKEEKDEHHHEGGERQHFNVSNVQMISKGCK
jgi:hypothetical protein